MYRNKTKEIEKGYQKAAVSFIFQQVKKTEGLTKFLDIGGGINGKWTNPDKAYDIYLSKFMTIVAFKIIKQQIDEVVFDLNEFVLWYSKYIKEHPEEFKGFYEKMERSKNKRLRAHRH